LPNEGIGVQYGLMSDPRSPRIPPLPAGEWNDFLQRLLEASPGGRERPLNIFTTLARSPDVFRRWIGFGASLLQGTIGDRERELVILRVAYLTESEYEWAQHVPMARAAGVTEAEVEALLMARERYEWPHADDVLLRVADELDFLGFLEDETWDGAHAVLGDAGMIELLMLVGQYQMVAMILRTLRIQLEDE
jgi:alkylhydroperoxidase family enzyme